jgi:hypothetical protein
LYALFARTHAISSVKVNRDLRAYKNGTYSWY